MVLRIRPVVAAAATTLLLASAPASAATHTATFDDLSAGTAVGTQYPGLSFESTAGGLPSVFVPVHVTTASPPHALHSAAPCDANCANGAYKLVMDFDPPASRVDLRAGLDDEPAGELPMCGRMYGYAAGGALVSDSGSVQLGPGGTYEPISDALAVSDPGGQPTIVKAVYVSGKETGTCDTGSPRRANIDSVSWQDATVTPPPRPPLPTVTITSPPNSSFFDRASDAAISGDVRFGTTVSPVSQFCVVADDGPAGDFPADCPDAGRLIQDTRDPALYHFAGLVPAALHGGFNFVHAWVRDRFGQTAHGDVVVAIADDRSGLDTRVDAMEVTQSVQGALPLSSEGFTTQYHGVQLVAGAHTIVRVFADAPGLARPGQPVRGVQLTLRGFTEPQDRGFATPLPGGPLLPDNGPQDLVHGSNVLIPAARRDDPNGAYVFTLPAAWTAQARRIRLVAEVNPTGMAATVPEPAAARIDNTFTVTNLELHHRNLVTIAPIMVTWQQPGTDRTWAPGPVADVFRELRNLVPLADDALRVLPYQATVDTTHVAYDMQSQPADQQSNYANNHSFDRVADVARRVDAGIPIGVNRGPGASDLARGLESPVFYGPTFDDPLRFEVKDVAIVNQGRPRSSVPHEFFHTMHFFHAGYYCRTDFPYVEWDPDHKGQLDSVGLNRAVPGPRAGTFQIIPDDGHHYDLMSYCGVPEQNYWVSAHNWNLFGLALPELPTTSSSDGSSVGRVALPRARSLRAATPLLAVLARVLPDGSASFESIAPANGTKATPSVAGESLQLIVKDAAGNVVSATGVTGAIGHVDGQPGNLSTLVAAEVPAANAASIELQRDGHVIAAATRSPHPPTVKVLAPHAGARVGGRRAVRISWSVDDADGGAKPTAQVDLSLDGGRHWRALTGDVTAAKATIPAALVPFARRARVRVRVSDGWNTAAATSQLFGSLGTPPQVTILAPAKGAALMAQGTLYASGQAVSDDGRFLTGRRLTWRDGRHVLGHGSAISVAGLAAGTHRLTLLARDAHGRTGRARVSVKVVGEAPDFVSLKVPSKLRASARRLTISTGATVPATLRIGARRFAVTRKVRAYTLKVPRGRKLLSLTLKLSAGGKRANLTVAVRRS
jgi:hypothetical protein